MSLTSRLTALLNYANNKTGAADTTLGDAVKTLCDNYRTPPVVIGEFSGNQTITISDYYSNVDSSSTADNFIIELIGIDSKTTSYTQDSGTNYFAASCSGCTINKSYDSGVLTISGATFTAGVRRSGGYWWQSTDCPVKYRVKYVK